MEHVDPQSLRIEFSRRVEIDRLRLFQRRQRAHMEEKQRHTEDRIEDEELLAQFVVEATAKDIAAFDTKLTHYEALTTAEIMRLQGQLDSLMQQRNDMLEKAFVLPDGRRVFRTADGTQVFDEHGVEVGSDIINPSDIGGGRPTWEAYSSNEQKIESAEKQLTEMQEFQTKLDDIRERFDQGEITAEQLKTLETELERSVPLSLRARDTALNIKEAPANATPVFTAAASNNINLDTLELDAPGLGS